MKSNALTRIASYQTLNQAWRLMISRSRPASRKTVGVDGVSINAFAEDAPSQIRRIVLELSRGAFQFLPLRANLIPKPNGKDRLICVPTVRDRIVQRTLLEFLTRKYHSRLANPISYGFVRYRTVADAAEMACAKRDRLPWIFKTDITSFFDQIDRDILARAIQRTVRDRSLYPLLLEALQSEVQESSPSTSKRIRGLGIRSGRGVRQGMPLSPLFANIVLQDFDQRVIDADYSAIRYADDLIFFAADRESCLEIFGFCKEQLRALGHSIPEIGPDTKSRIYEPGEAAEFLGLGLVKSGDRYVLRLMPQQVSRIRTELLQLGSIEELLSRRVTLATLGAYVQSRVNGYLGAYEICTNWTEVEAGFNDLVGKVLNTIYRDGLQINVPTLSKAGRTFLGLDSTTRTTDKVRRFSHQERRRTKRSLAQLINTASGEPDSSV